MARDNKVHMPMATAGLTRYFDDYKSKFEFRPGHVIVLCAAVAMIVILLHLYVGSLFGL